MLSTFGRLNVIGRWQTSSGRETSLSGWMKSPERHKKDYVNYLRRRTILELAFSAAKARGLAQLSWLAVDRCGMYYELYRRAARAAGMADDEIQNWNDLSARAGVVEHVALPDVVQAKPSLCEPIVSTPSDEHTFKLREFVSGKLADHVLSRSGLGGTDAKRKQRLARTLEALQTGSEVEIQPTDDRVCSKAFSDPIALPTITSLRTFTHGLFQGISPEDEVYIICETGEWLLTDETMYKLLSNQHHVQVITAFELKSGDLDKKYQHRLKHIAIDPWRHNRHMTIVCRGSSPHRAVYFARRLRTPLITPVYLKNPTDAARVKRAFDLMYYEAGGSLTPSGVEAE